LNEEALRAFDVRPDLYDAQCGLWEPFISDLEPGTEHIAVTTMLPLVVNIEQILDTLHMPRFACWLQEITSTTTTSETMKG
jgi:hypothetical protein